MFELSKNKINELMKISSKKGSVNIDDFKNILKSKNQNKNEFNFETTIKNENDLYIIEFNGKHFAKNVIQNTWHRGILLAYKKAIKTSAKNAFLKAKSNNILPINPLNEVEIKIEVYNPRSRDDDANYDTLKWMRDTFTVHKLIIDDNREVIKSTIEKEIISKEWKIIFYIKKLS